MIPAAKDADKDRRRVRFSTLIEDKEQRKPLESCKDIERTMSTEKVKIPRSLYLHRKNKSNDYGNAMKVELPTMGEILARILNNSASPEKLRSQPRADEILLSLPKPYKTIISPSKASLIKKTKKYSLKNHFRSVSPLKPFNDRIFQLRRLFNK